MGWVVLGQSLAALQLAGFAIALGAIAYGAAMTDRSPRVAGRDRERQEAAMLAPTPARTAARLDTVVC